MSYARNVTELVQNTPLLKINLANGNLWTLE